MNAAALRALAQRVSEFYITDGGMKRAQREIEDAFRQGMPDDAAAERYLNAIERYFAGFEREARTHLRDVDRRLEHINQVHFNLTAERGVAVKRIEATQGVLQELRRVRSDERD